MADKKISDLDAMPAIADADLFAMVDNTDATTKKGTVSQITSFLKSVATPATYLAAETITGSERNLPVAGNGGPVDLTSNPQMTLGNDGEERRLIGTSDTNTLTIVDGNGFVLDNGQSMTLGLNDILKVVSYNSLWLEDSRKDN